MPDGRKLLSGAVKRKGSKGNIPFKTEKNSWTVLTDDTLNESFTKSHEFPSIDYEKAIILQGNQAADELTAAASTSGANAEVHRGARTWKRLQNRSQAIKIPRGKGKQDAVLHSLIYQYFITLKEAMLSGVSEARVIQDI